MIKERSLLVLIIVILLSSCGEHESGDNRKLLVKRIDSLQTELEAVRKLTTPRSAVLMHYMGIHHSRLWEAGIKQNWKLADYKSVK